MPPLPGDKRPQNQQPAVRLAITNDGAASKQARYPKALSGEPKPGAPSARLAINAELPNAFAKGMSREPKPDERLAHKHDGQGTNCLMGAKGVPQLPPELAPALLVSYWYLERFLESRERYCYRDWVMDSGAFSAHNSGAEIVLQDYIDVCKQLIDYDPKLVEIYSLDVIGDWRQSLKNTEEMWRQGLPAIPCFHIGEPWDLLVGLAKDYPKIALGGAAMVKTKRKMEWASQCFARIWPKKVHGFAFCSEAAVLGLPFHSVDASNWELGPCKFGRWNAFGGAHLSVRGSQQNLRAEVEWYLELERKARVKWKKQMTELEALQPAPSLRLALCNSPAERNGTLEGPTIRLAEADSGRVDAKVEAFKPKGGPK